jgi:hypothetical protein
MLWYQVAKCIEVRLKLTAVLEFPAVRPSARPYFQKIQDPAKNIKEHTVRSPNLSDFFKRTVPYLIVPYRDRPSIGFKK